MLVDPLKNMLKVSYDRLDEKQKQIFLDIVIFFCGKEVDTIKRIWEEEFEDSFKLEEDSEDSSPRGRSRLWRPKDVKKVLQSFKGSENVRGLSLVFGGSVVWNRDRFGRPCAWPADAFANMKELKLLELGDDCVEGDLGKLPQELVWLRWRNYPNDCMPSNLPINHARVLDFCGGELVSVWDDQSQVPLKLQELNLQRCYKLQRVPDSIGRLRGLQKLDFSECLFLKTLSEEFCYLESLEVLSLNGCLNLEYLPSSFGGMRRLRDVSLRECEKLKALPESFGLLPQIEYLDMTRCKNVKIEEGSFGSISTLKEVNLFNCRKLETLPTQLTSQRSLKKLMWSVGYSGEIVGFGDNEILIDIPENIGDLSQLTSLRSGNLTRIPQSIGKLCHLEDLRLWNCTPEELPTFIGNLSCLSRLQLSDCPRLQGLPTSIGNLSCLEYLYLWNCPRLQRLPTSIGDLSRLEQLGLSNCPRLQGLPTSIGNLSRLKSLHLSNFPSLQGLPTSIGNLSRLKWLHLSNCPRLQGLPTSIGNLSRLEQFYLCNCPRLQRLPTSIGNLSRLEHLELSNCPSLQRLPTSIGNLSRLNSLRLLNCPRLQGLPTSIGNLSRLESLNLSNCPRLQGLPTSIGNLSRLECLSLDGFAGAENGLPTSVANLGNLKGFALSHCLTLQRLPTCIINLSGFTSLRLEFCPRLKEIEVEHLTNLRNLILTSCSDLQNITGLSSLRNLSTLKLDYCHKLSERAILDLCQCKSLKNLDLLLTDSFLTEENSVLLENLISPSLEFTFTSSAIPYPTAWLDSDHFQMMSKWDTMLVCSDSSGLECSLPVPIKKKCHAVIICFVSVLQLIDELNDNRLAVPPLAQLHFKWKQSNKNWYQDGGHDLSCSKLGDTIHLKMLSLYDIHEKTRGLNVLMDKLSSSVKGYFKYGWIKIIKKEEEKLIQQIWSDFFRELRRQRPLAVARASAPSLLDLRNVHALDIANCTIRRTLYLYKTPIQEENMDLVLRKKKLFWRDDKKLEHLDLSIVNTTSIPLFLTLRSMVIFYKMEVIISSKSVEVYKDELQEYDNQHNSVINSHANIPVQVAKILKYRSNESILKSNKRGKDRVVYLGDR